MLVFIGSVALNQYRQAADRKPINDIDAIADYDTAAEFLKKVGCTTVHPINNGKTLYGRNPDRIYEIEIAWLDTSAAILLERIRPEKISHIENNQLDTDIWYGYASLDLLYTLKMSHRYLRNSPHFLKTMSDIHEMRSMGAKIPTEWHDWYLTRQKETYWYQLPNLNRSKDEFFVDQYQYDHDSIHEAVAVYNKPAYKYYEVEGKEVLSSKDKFYSVSDDIRLAGVVEEASVLALERSLIPHGTWSEDKAFEYALMKVCTSITSGWFREFAWENYEAALKMYKARPWGLLQMFNHGLVKGWVKENPNYGKDS